MQASCVSISDLKRITEEFAGEDLAGVLEKGDVELIKRVIASIAATLEEAQVKIDPDQHMLRCSEACTVAGFLRAKYHGRARRSASARKLTGAQASIEVRDDLLRTGAKVTEGAVASNIEADSDYIAAIEYENRAEEVAEHMYSLHSALRQRLDVLIEISRNERALVKDSKER
jgi:hypothetical protein